MASRRFGWNNFAPRWFFALLLVLATWNPAGLSWMHWALADLRSFGPWQALSGLLLIVGWTIYLRATFRSLGVVGMALVAALFACLVWLLFELGWVRRDSAQAVAWLVEFGVATLMAVGMSWSHVRRRLSGQVDMDDVEE